MNPADKALVILVSVIVMSLASCVGVGDYARYKYGTCVKQQDE
jgi:hypothetical protein